MITIIYSTHKDQEYNNKFKQHLLQTVGVKDVQILEYVNHNQYSLSEVYNSGITQSNYDIVCCIHNDIKLEKNWGKKLLQDFSNNPEFGIIGKAGSCYFPKSGVYWERMHYTMVGQVYHHPEGQKKWVNKYSTKLPFLIPVVTIDGLFISFDKTKIKHRFDETIGRFHFYDHLFCLPNYLDGIKIGVTSSFEITHESVGQPNQEFWESKDKFIEKWGHHLPLDLKPENLYIPKLKEKPLKNVGKVAVIIPTKSKLDLLFKCIDSLYDFCDSNIFEIFIADTGSSPEEKSLIKQKITNYNNIKLIEYDYYNFSKINNDVVKNHIGDNFEFLLFCNNDIEIKSNVIYGMLKTFKENPKTGSVGCRLHYKDNTLQHNGICVIMNQLNKSIDIEHIKRQSYYSFELSETEPIGNTAALIMIRKNTFTKLGGFDEKFRHCFEDVFLSLQLIKLGYINYNLGQYVAYHYEKQTRKDKENMSEIMEDYNNILAPFIRENFDKLKKYILIKN